MIFGGGNLGPIPGLLIWSADLRDRRRTRACAAPASAGGCWPPAATRPRPATPASTRSGSSSACSSSRPWPRPSPACSTPAACSPAASSSAPGDELSVIAAAVLGGTSLFGGAGTVVGTLVRCADDRPDQQRPDPAGLEFSQQLIARGAIIIIAVAMARKKWIMSEDEQQMIMTEATQATDLLRSTPAGHRRGGDGAHHPDRRPAGGARGRHHRLRRPLPLRDRLHLRQAGRQRLRDRSRGKRAGLAAASRHPARASTSRASPSWTARSRRWLGADFVGADAGPAGPDPGRDSSGRATRPSPSTTGPSRDGALRPRSEPALQQTSTETELDFLPLLAMHTRQGFYADPIYGGNRDRVGWQVIGFPGPRSLEEVFTRPLQHAAPGSPTAHHGQGRRTDHGAPGASPSGPRSASSAPALPAPPPPRS